jgi:ankyrin repeat protein
LSHAIQHQNAAFLKLILPYAGAQVNGPDSSGHFPLQHCVAQCFAEGVLLLDELCPSLNTNLCAAPDNHPLHVCLGRDGAALLAIRRIDLNAYDCGGETPLHRAVCAKQFDGVRIVQTLIACGAFVNQPTAEGVPPLFAAAQKNDVQMVALLLKNGANPRHWPVNGSGPEDVATGKCQECLRQWKEGVPGQTPHEKKSRSRHRASDKKG